MNATEKLVTTRYAKNLRAYLIWSRYSKCLQSDEIRSAMVNHDR